MQKAVYSISLAYAILFGWAWYATATGSQDAAGRGMALGFLTVGIGVSLIFVLPALILALTDKAPKWALGLALTPAALMVLTAITGVL